MLEIKNLSKKFKRETVLHNINFSVGPGVYGLLGPNGSGKTTLLRCITGLYSDYAGTITWDENINLKQKQLNSIGYLPQQFGLFPGSRTIDALKLFADIKDIPHNDQKLCIASALESTGLLGIENSRIKTLSIGTIRRLGIAQAIMGNPSLLVLDEPTAGLDPEERVRFKNVVSALPAESTTILSTHIVDDVVSLCDGIIVLLDGNVIAVGSCEQIAEYANGLVYQVGVEHELFLREPYFIVERNNTTLRIISPNRQPGDTKSPELIDGYLCLVKGYAHATD